MKASKLNITNFQNKLLHWYNRHGRHHLPWRDKNLGTYKIVIAEILLQRTKAETIEKFYRPFLEIFPTWKTIADANIEDIEENLKPIGLHKQRAKRLKNLAKEMVLLRGRFPRKRDVLEKLPFLGQYIVNAIELQVFNIAKPLLDVNMARVLERYFGERKLADIRYDPYLQDLAKKVVSLPNDAKQINWAILDFAAAICKSRNPLCGKCPLSGQCRYFLKSKH